MKTLGLRSIEASKKGSGHRMAPFDELSIAVIAEDLGMPLDEGSKRIIFSIIREFMKKRISVSIFTSHKNLDLGNVYQLPENRFLVGASFRSNLRAQAPDIILYMPASSGTVGAFIRATMIKMQSSSIPLCLLNTQYRELPAYTRYLRFDRYIDLVFTLSPASTNILQSLGMKTILLSGGVDCDVFKPAGKQEKMLLRSKYGFQEKDQIVLHVGHGNRARNAAILARLIEFGFTVMLVFSTTTPTDAGLLADLRNSGVNVFDEYIDDIQDFYKMADCYVFPVSCSSSAIDIPLSVLEAMACNLPVVTTRFGGLPAWFEPGKGIYYGSTDEEILRLVKEAMKENDCKTLEKVSCFSWENMAATILEKFQEDRIQNEIKKTMIDGNHTKKV